MSPRKLITLFIGLAFLMAWCSACKSIKWAQDKPDDTTSYPIDIKLPPVEVAFNWEVARPGKDTVYYDRNGVELRIIKSGDSILPEVKCPGNDTTIEQYIIRKYYKTEKKPPKGKIRWWHLVIALFAGGLLVKVFGK